MRETQFYQAAAGAVPVLLLVMATEKRLNPIRPTKWKRLDVPILLGGAVLLASLIVSETFALGALLKDRYPLGVTAFIMASLGIALIVVAWALGWAIWREYPADRLPPPRSPQKRAFFAVGLVTVLTVTAATVWGLS